MATTPPRRRRSSFERLSLDPDYRALFDQSPSGLYQAAPDGRFIRANPALLRILGYTAESDVHHLAAGDVYLRPSDHDLVVTQLGHRLPAHGVEVEWRHRDGRPLTVRLGGRPLHADDGALEGFEMVAEDVTEQRALERTLQQVQKLETIGQLTGGIAHDFNNILTLIFAHAAIVEERLPPGNEELRRELEQLTNAAMRGATLVRKLLAYSRKERLEPRSLAVADWLRETARAFARLLPPTVELSVRADPDTGSIHADPGALEQVFVNLVTNGRDAMPEGGALEVEVRATRLTAEDRPLHAWIKPGPYVCFSVSDSGSGMDAETQARIFEPLFTTKPAGAGTGLGMAVVYGLVKEQRGFIHVYSELGHGTVVKVYLPRVDADPSSATLPEAAELPRGTGTVLLIEDDAQLRSVAERLLKRMGYDVMAAPDGAAGLDLFAAHGAAIVAVMTDLMMPRADGVEVYRALRAQAPRLGILVTSGYAAPAARALLEGDPHARFVTKPWVIGEVLGALHDLRRPLGAQR